MVIKQKNDEIFLMHKFVKMQEYHYFVKTIVI